MHTHANQNVDQDELNKFDVLAHRWWDPESEFKPLHKINPLRLDWINQIIPLQDKRVLDVGCGGGILAESMAHHGAQVTGIDLSDKALSVAKLHLIESGFQVSYRKISAEELANEAPHSFDLVTCLEMLEHVPDPSRTIRACATLVRPGGHIFFSTINRSIKSYLLAVIGAEYILKLLPAGTHDFTKFIRPAELVRYCLGAGLRPEKITGLTYNPLTKTYALDPNPDVNYLMYARRDA